MLMLGLMIVFVTVTVLVDKVRTSNVKITELENDLAREKHNHSVKDEELRKVTNHQETLNVRINELEIELGQAQEDLSVERENHKKTMADSHSKDDVVSHLTSEVDKLKKARASIAKQSEAKPKVKAQPEQQIQTANVPDEQPKDSGGRKLDMRVTAYGADCNGCEGKTASGTNYTKGRTLACPPQYAFGTKIDIPTLGGTFVCEDRGGAIKGNTFDMFYGANEADASSFGVKYVEGYIRE